MYHYMDYLAWRGDLPVAQAPFCEVDYMVMSRLAYVPFDGVVPQGFDVAPILLKDAVQQVIYRIEEDEARQEKEAAVEAFLKQLADCPRYDEMKLCCYTDIYDEEIEEQFAAVTVLLPDGTVLVAYRGTDGTLIGWKEDFNMGFAKHVPAQQDAAYYLTETARRFPGGLRLTGHSKGGNLAMYAGAFCDGNARQRILAIRNFDGPGFNEQLAGSPEFSAVLDRTLTFLPQSSIVGLLLAHPERCEVVLSNGNGLFQHDLSTWAVDRSVLVRAKGLTEQSRKIDRTLKEWLSGLTNKQREALIDGVFEVLDASDAKTVDELWTGKNILEMLKEILKGKDK